MVDRIRPFILLIFFCMLMARFSMVGAQEELRYFPIVSAFYPADEPEDEGPIDFEDLVINELEENTADRWMIDLSAGDALTVSAAPVDSADIILSIYDGESLLHTQNLSPEGEVETISDLLIPKSGRFELLVQSVHGRPTGYAMMVLNQDSFTFLFRGVLRDGDSRDESLTADADHFWFFSAREGQTVNFTVSPLTSSDPYVEVYDPTAIRLLAIDSGGIGEPERLRNFQAFTPGVYGIRVGEFDFQAMDYQITLSLP